MFSVRVADLQIEIHHQYEYLPRLCKGYMKKEATPDLTVTVTPADIQKEADRSPEPSSPAYTEGLACYRKIADALSERDGCLLHGVLMEMDGRGILICAKSGVGKTTHAKMWQEAFGSDRCQIVNGDKPLLRKINGKIYGYGTPWCGKEGISQNRRVEITDILMIRRGEDNSAAPLAPASALRLLLDQLYIPDGSVTARLNVLDLANDLLSHTRIYSVSCTPTPDAALVAFTALHS